MERFVSSKKPGNILSAFKANIDDNLPDEFKSIKKEIVQCCDEKTLEASWVRLIDEFEKEIELIKEMGPEIVPQVEYSAIVENDIKFPSIVADEIRKRGCVVIRNVVDRNEALKYKELVQQYINNHRDEIVGFPGKISFTAILLTYYKDDNVSKLHCLLPSPTKKYVLSLIENKPQVWEIYWSKVK